MMTPSYTAAIDRLHRFVPKAGSDYARNRNYDDTAHVSALSPYIRHRIISEEDVLWATLAQHSPKVAEKFIQEVYWRTYWKGWLEQRPSIWLSYKADLNAALNRVQTESGLRHDWEAACKGETGIDCFDHWAKQLADTGYLHNHARMWFASIWIFTLRLPWTLGADFFMRHLLDGDPASNTLSWRWVGGLQTIGKTYLARADNIAKYTQGRFDPKGLATHAVPLDALPHPARGPVPITGRFDPSLRTGLLVTEEDLSLGWMCDQITPVATATVQTTSNRSSLAVSRNVTAFVDGAINDCAARFVERTGPIEACTPQTLSRWAKENDIAQIVTSYAPVGPTADALENINLVSFIRPYDQTTWPHATHGFFRFRENIPAFIGQLKGLNLI